MNSNGTKSQNKTTLSFRFGLVAVLASGAFVIVAGGLFAYYWQQDQERQAFVAEAANLSRTVRSVAQPAVATSQNPNDLQSSLERISEIFPAEHSSSAAVEAILKAASASGVQVTGVQEAMPMRKIIGEHVYYAWPFVMRVKAAPEDLLGMMQRFEASEAGPAIIQKVTLAKAQAGYTAFIDGAFYTRSRTESAPTPTPTARKSQKGTDTRAQK